MQSLIDPVIDDIYERAANAAHFQRMFESLCRAVNASRGLFMFIGLDCTIFHSYNVDPESTRLYNTVYLSANPLYKAATERNALARLAPRIKT